MSNIIWNTTIPTKWLVWEWLLDWDALDTSWEWNDWDATDVTFVDSERGYVKDAGSFNGSSSNVNMWGKNIISQDYTLSVWVKQTSSDSNTSPLSNWSSDWYMIYFTDDDIRLYSNDTYDTYTDWQLILNNWKYHLITWIKNWQLSKLYIDWNLIWTGWWSLDNTINHSDEELIIWTYWKSDNYWDYLTWNISQPKIYNRALSPLEIQQLYYSEKWNFIN